MFLRKVKRVKIEEITSYYIGGGYVIKIRTDSGISGLGQTACWGYPEAVHQIVNRFKDYLIGQNPLRIEHHWQYLYRMSPFRGSTLSGAISAIDIALWDIKGKYLDVPVWELLGGNCRDKIRLHLLSGGDTPESMYDSAQKAASQGFTALKFDPLPSGYQDMSLDRMTRTARDLVAAARDGGGQDMDLIVELHRKLTPLTAMPLASALTEFNIFFIEDPIQIDSIMAQGEISRRLGIPVGNGERLNTIWEFQELLAQGGPQYVRPDVALAGGLTHCKKIAAIAEAHHCAVVTHNFLTPLITSASIHLDASIPNFVTQEYSLGDESESNAVFRTDLKRNGGYIPLPQSSGLGVILDDEKLEKAKYSPMNKATTPLRSDGSVANSV
tara:strand:- start:11324 stop:12475 length:1152 start_codon:yes stop_codon:yes gene_type:complete